MPFWATLAAFNADPPPVTSHLIRPVLAYGSAFGFLYGAPGLGKTQLSLSLALAVARGEPWLGLYPTRQSRAAFVQLDMPHSTFWERTRKTCAEAPLLSVLHHDRAFDVLAPRDTLKALQAVSPEFVAVESLRKAHRLDENDSNTPVQVYKAWQTQFPQASFTFAHHDRKAALLKNATSDERAQMREEAFRGSSAWQADADLGIHVVAENAARNFEDLQVRLEFTKVRAGPPQPPLSVRFDPLTWLPFVTDPSLETALRIELLARPASQRDAAEWVMQTHKKSRAQAYRIVDKMPELLV